jgi:hypothetical protein
MLVHCPKLPDALGDACEERISDRNGQGELTLDGGRHIGQAVAVLCMRGSMEGKAEHKGE